METKKINQPGTSPNRGKNNDKQGNSAAVGAATVAGMTAGAVGMNVVAGNSIEEEAAAQESVTAQAQDLAEQLETVETAQETEREEPQPVAEVAPVVEAQPVTGVGDADGTHEPASPQEPVGNVEPVNGEEPPTDLVGSIISGEEIDPADVDETDIINVDQIGTVYTVDGQNMLAAAIHDDEGNELMMVDVDGDGVFDVVTTPEGEAIAEVGGDIDVSDAEHMMTGEDSGWLAANDFDNSMDVGSDIQNDIIEA